MPTFATLPNVLGLLDQQGGDVHASLISAITAALNNMPGGPRTQLSFDEVNEICYEMMVRGDYTYRQNPTFKWWFEYGQHVLIRSKDIIKEPRNAPHHMLKDYEPRMNLFKMRPIDEPTEPPAPKFELFLEAGNEPSVVPSDEPTPQKPSEVDILSHLYPPMPSPAAVVGYAEPLRAPQPSRAHGLTISTIKSAKSFTLSATASPFVPGGSAQWGSPTLTPSSSSSFVDQVAKASSSRSRATSTPVSTIAPTTKTPSSQSPPKQTSTKEACKSTSKSSGKSDKKANPKSTLVAVPDFNLLFGPSGPIYGRKRTGATKNIEGGSEPTMDPNKAHKKTVAVIAPIPSASSREEAIREWVRSLIQKVDMEIK